MSKKSEELLERTRELKLRKMRAENLRTNREARAKAMGLPAPPELSYAEVQKLVEEMDQLAAAGATPDSTRLPPEVPSDWDGYEMLDRWYVEYRAPLALHEGSRPSRGKANKTILARRIFLMMHFMTDICIGGDPEPHGSREEAWEKWMDAMDREKGGSGTLGRSPFSRESWASKEAHRVFRAVDLVTPFT